MEKGDTATGNEQLAVQFYRDRLQRKLAWKKNEEVEDYEMANSSCEPSTPFSHPTKNRDKPYIGPFNLDPPLPKMKAMKVIHLHIRGPIAMPKLLPRDK